jgi:60 kDa SS-A/Ro ribonucleoprotein
MANKNLFSKIASVFRPKAQKTLRAVPEVPKADAVNAAGGRAYLLSDKQALAQYAVTGCLNSTFYATAEMQLDQVLKLAAKVEPRFLAQTAVYARQRGLMKDMPALLLASLSSRDASLFEATFPAVIDDAKMLRNFVQVMRSGAVGRRSLGSLPKRMIKNWLEARSEEGLFKSAVGQSPSLADVLKMTHPRPSTPSREALYGYLIGREHQAEALPALVKRYEEFKKAAPGSRGVVPDVSFQMLTSLGLSSAEWAQVACRASWQTLRMNLNTFARHGVFNHPGVTELIAKRLADPGEISRAKVFPYQLMMAAKMVDAGVPAVIRTALAEAMEIAIANVPSLGGKVYVCPDVSGSMSSPVTGHRAGATTAVRCIDVAALVAASVLRQNPGAEVLPFECKVVNVKLDAKDSVMTNAQKLASIGGGGTNCSAPLAKLNAQKARGDVVIYVSDNESWADQRRAGQGTGMMHEWAEFKRRNPGAKLVCIDIQPSTTAQAKSSDDVLNVGGFSDAVFDVLAAFAESRDGADHWVRTIENNRARRVG